MEDTHSLTTQHMDPRSKIASASYMRNFVFGVEDSLVSTVGLLSGIAIAEVPPQTIFLTGIVLIFVEAFSMAVGSFLSEISAEGYITRSETPTGTPIAGGFVMFFSYFVSGFIPLFPYIIFDVGTAFWFSIALSLVSLFILGVIGAKLSQTRILKNAVRMLVIGGIAVAVGIAVGMLVPQY
ncbi:MAG: VIT1/CCC1 transporter family protein [bacterium]|nr:VIT1/CCC1 transporter family protein [bacterium]